MPAQNYTYLSKIYSHLMRSIDYNVWAKFILFIAEKTNKKYPKVLELACGLGSVAEILKDYFKYYYVSDISFDMLSSPSLNDIPKICCDMTALPFNKKFDFVFSTFDSVNYLLTKSKFMEFLDEVSRVMAPKGILTFDVSLEKNSINYEKYLNRKGKVEKIKYRQSSRFNQKTRIHHNRFEIILQDGKVIEENHKQKIFTFEEYFLFIEESDFYVEDCLETFSFKKASKDSERAQFILRKKS